MTTELPDQKPNNKLILVFCHAFEKFCKIKSGAAAAC